MVKYKQKVFFAPLALLGGGSSVMGALSVGTSAYGIKQMNSQLQQGEQQMRLQRQLQQQQQRFDRQQQARELKAQQEMQKRQLEAQEKQNKLQKELQAQKNTMSSLAPTDSEIQEMAEKGFSMIEFKRKNFGSVWNWQNIKGLVKDTGEILKKDDNKHHFGKMAVAGLAMGAGSYAVNKAISNDMKNSGISLEQMRKDIKPQQTQDVQKTYSSLPQAISKVGNKISNTWKLAKKHGYDNELLIGAGFTGAMAIPTVIGYKNEKEQLKNLYGNQQTQLPQQRQYGIGTWLAKKTAPIRTHPGQTILGFISHLAMGGGHKAAENAARSYVNQGAKSGNVLTQKVGNFLTNNKKTAIAATIPVGLGTTALLWEGGEKVAKGIGKTIDKDAYTYENWQGQQIQ